MTRHFSHVVFGCQGMIDGLHQVLIFVRSPIGRTPPNKEKARRARSESSMWEMYPLIIPHISCADRHGPRGLHTNAGLKVKFTHRFRKMHHSKKETLTDSIRHLKKWCTF